MAPAAAVMTKTATDMLQLLLVLILFFYLLPAIGLCLLFMKAGVPGWKGFIPVYRSYIMLSIGNYNRSWALLQFIPILGIFFYVTIASEFIRTFGKKRFYQVTLAAVLPGPYYIYMGLHDRFKGLRSSGRPQVIGGKEVGVGFIILGIWMALRLFVYEIYTLPTGSMEKTLRIGDWLVVNKLAYGSRLSATPYSRVSSGAVGRGDILVFNFPEGDTVINLPDYQSLRPYYDVIRELGAGNSDSGRQIVLNNPDQYPLVVRPVDKRVSYIKRCVAIPGDTLAVRNQVFYVDGQPQPFPPGSETYYRVRTKGQPLDADIMRQQFGVNMDDMDEFRPLDSTNAYDMLLTWDTREKMMKEGIADAVIPDIDSSEAGIFPNDSQRHWTRDNYGPIWIPKKGATIQLTRLNYPLYERAIRTYEGNKLEWRNGKIYLNDREASNYTFKMNYYWVIGDNLHGSQDSRYWGFVPEDHVIGKAWLVLASHGQNMRWDRTLKLLD